MYNTKFVSLLEENRWDFEREFFASRWVGVPVPNYDEYTPANYYILSK